MENSAQENHYENHDENHNYDESRDENHDENHNYDESHDGNHDENRNYDENHDENHNVDSGGVHGPASHSPECTFPMTSPNQHIPLIDVAFSPVPMDFHRRRLSNTRMSDTPVVSGTKDILPASQSPFQSANTGPNSPTISPGNKRTVNLLSPQFNHPPDSPDWFDKALPTVTHNPLSSSTGDAHSSDVSTQPGSPSSMISMTESPLQVSLPFDSSASDERIVPQEVPQTNNVHPTSATDNDDGDISDNSHTSQFTVEVDNGPIRRISLVRLLSFLMWSRQRGRTTKSKLRWEIHHLRTLENGKGVYKVTWDGREIVGMKLIKLKGEHGGKKPCILGCRKEGKHMWIGSDEYVPSLSPLHFTPASLLL